ENDEVRNRTQRIDALINSLPAEQRHPVLKMLETMFPIVERPARRSSFSDGSYTRWRQECRICSPDRFDFYDRLSIPSGAISSADLTRILRSSTTEALRNDLQRLIAEQAYDGSTKLKKFLEYAPGAVAALSMEERQSLLKSIFRVADEFISKLEPPSLP